MLGVASHLSAAGSDADSLWVYFGTFTSGFSEGIYVSELDIESGHLSDPTLVTRLKNPAFLAVHPANRHLYAISGSNPGTNVSAFQIQKDDTLTTFSHNRRRGILTVFAIHPERGTLTFVENVPSQTITPRGFGIDPTGNYLIVGGQKSNHAAVLRIDMGTGRLLATGYKIDVGAPVCVDFVPR
jgi:6-phosphogluconolactonase